jgi:hypothetical protein
VCCGRGRRTWTTSCRPYSSGHGDTGTGACSRTRLRGGSRGSPTGRRCASTGAAAGRRSWPTRRRSPPSRVTTRSWRRSSASPAASSAATISSRGWWRWRCTLVSSPRTRSARAIPPGAKSGAVWPCHAKVSSPCVRSCDVARVRPSSSARARASPVRSPRRPRRCRGRAAGPCCCRCRTEVQRPAPAGPVGLAQPHEAPHPRRVVGMCGVEVVHDREAGEREPPEQSGSGE